MNICIEFLNVFLVFKLCCDLLSMYPNCLTVLRLSDTFEDIT